MTLTRRLLPDLVSARQYLVAGQAPASGWVDRSLAAADGAADSATDRRIFIRRFDAQARAAAAAIDALRAAGAPVPPLAGLPVSVKDLFDVAGWPTTGGAAVLGHAAAAQADSETVARLRAAGAALIGHTNMSEFAYSGVGINPHHGTAPNVVTQAIDGSLRIPGGSTSGGATSVAVGAAFAALGSDTGGSIRIPAALQGLVGFKNTQSLTPLHGSLPLSESLDTACAITASVRDAVLLHEVLSARRMQAVARPLHALRLAVPTTTVLDELDAGVATAFDSALRALRSAGAQIDEVPMPLIAELAGINAHGGFTAAESWHWHRSMLESQGDLYDPRVAARIRRGAAMSAADYIELLQTRKRWIAAMQTALGGFDAALSPTVPVVAPLLEPLLHDDAAFFAANALLLRNPSVVNFLDGCALSLPCHADGCLPVGLMVWGPALHDDVVLGVSLVIEHCIQASRGA